MDFKVFVLVVHLGSCVILCTDAVSHQYHYIDSNLNWTDAQRYCREKYTDLATFESMEDIKRFLALNEDSLKTWIGLRDDPKSWKGIMGKDENSWRWFANGTTETTGYQKWNHGEPDNLNGEESCVLMMTGSWFDVPCKNGRTYYFVCFTAQNPSGKKKYTLIKLNMTKEDALDYCRKYHTDLAVIDNEEENNGVVTEASVHNVWIGLYREAWTWSDCSQSAFRNWETGRPNNFGKEHCAFIKPGGRWDDGKCYQEIPFLCHEDTAVQPSPQSFPFHPGPHPITEVQTGGDEGVLSFPDRKSKQNTTVRMKIETAADLSDPQTHQQVLQQLVTMLRNKLTTTNLNLTWMIPPKKEKVEEKRDGTACAKP